MGILILLTSVCSSAKYYGDLTFETVGDINLIPEGVVTDVFQDQQGYIWIGTQRGIVRYDGYQYKNFNHSQTSDNEISGNFISKITQNQNQNQNGNGNIWIGTENDGISVFDPKTEIFTSFQHSEDDDTSLAHNQINDILIDKNNTKWVATPRGLNVQKEGQEGFKLITQELTNHEVTALFLDNNETLWVGTKQGLFVFNTSLQKLILYKAKQEDLYFYANLEVSVIMQSDNNDIWVGTKEQGLVILSNNTDKAIHLDADNDLNRNDILSDHWVSSILQTTSEYMWVAMFSGGIDVIDITTKKIVKRIKHDISVPASLNLNSVSKLMLDNSGLLWVGTWGGGLNMHNTHQSAFKILHYSPTNLAALSHPNIFSILELQDGRWLAGTAENGIDILNASFERIGGIRHSTKKNNELSLPKGAISSLAQTEDGKVWIGTVNNGLYEYDLLTNTLRNYAETNGLKKGNIYRIVADQNNLWLGTRFGPYYFDRELNTFSPILAENKQVITSRVNSIALDNNKNLWLGTDNGLYYKEAGNTLARHFPHNRNDKKTISSNQVSGILIDSKNHVWVDTGVGLNRLVSLTENDAIFESISEKVNKPGYYFGGNLLEDSEGIIWTQESILNPKTYELTLIEKSGGTDIGTVWINSLEQSESGLLLFGGTKGILIINPQDFSQRKYHPALAVTNVNIDGKHSVLSSSTVVMPPNSQRLSIEFTAFDYLKPEANKYKYILEGYNKDWITTSASNRRVTYTNLPVGEYTLKLEGAGPSGNWSKNGIELTIIIEPEFYQTFIFRLVAILVFCGFFYGIYLLRINQLKKQQQMLKKQVLQRTKELEFTNQSLITAQAELKASYEKMEKISETDQLTGLKNRHFLSTHISADIQKVLRDYRKRESSKNAIIPDDEDRIFFMIDLDHFKRINDTYGHNAGDKVLKSMKEILSKIFRDSDYLIRWGGEEFLVIARFTNHDEASTLAERIRTHVESYQFEIENQVYITQTCSVGFACFPFITAKPEEVSWEQVVEIADVCLYIAKNSQRNAWVGMYGNETGGIKPFMEYLANDPQVLLKNKQISIQTSLNNEDDICWNHT
jgi:diguanylate cyclase (GGDEF)-like protein